MPDGDDTLLTASRPKDDDGDATAGSVNDPPTADHESPVPTGVGREAGDRSPDDDTDNGREDDNTTTAQTSIGRLD